MKDYPSIPVATGQSFREFDAHVFDKLDGSQCRAEWTRKRGWSKFGTRTRLVDRSDPVFGRIPELFEEQLAGALTRIAVREKWLHLVVFCEFWGPSSFAGLHVAEEPMTLTLFDAAADKRGILPPGEFRRLFEGHVATPRFLGQQRWTRGFCQRVRAGEVEGITFEGVVGKEVQKGRLITAKAKTAAWLEKVRALYGERRALEEGLAAFTDTRAA